MPSCYPPLGSTREQELQGYCQLSSMMSLFSPQSGEEILFFGQFSSLFDEMARQSCRRGENSSMKENKLTIPALEPESAFPSQPIVLKIDLEHDRLWVVSEFFTKDIKTTYIQVIGFDAQPNLNIWFLSES